MKKVCVVILNWNGEELTRGCLESLRHSDYANLDSVVTDNGSTDGSIDAIARDFPDTGVIRNASNLGFAAGCNQGIAWGLERGAEYLLMLNNDTRVDPSMVSHLVAAATAHNDRAAAIPKIYWESDPQRFWFAVGRTNLWTGVFSNVAFNQIDDGSFDSYLQAQYASGCCILMPSQVVRKIGGFDREYFAYVEDVDWSLRCRDAGFPLVFCPAAKLWHKVSATGGRQPARYRYLTTRNHLWTLRRHSKPYQFLVFAVVFYPLRCLLRIAVAARHRQWESIFAEFRGAFAGFFSPRHQDTSIDS